MQAKICEKGIGCFVLNTYIIANINDRSCETGKEYRVWGKQLQSAR